MLVAVQLSVLGLYLPPVFKIGRANTTPDNHLASGPNCRVARPGIRRVGSACGNPRVCGGIIPTSGVYTSAPDNHFAAGPDCGVRRSAFRRIDSASGCPAIRARIISSAGVQFSGDIIIPPQTIISLPVHTAV